MIRFDDVSKSFTQIRALSQVSFEIPSGARVGLLGPNGSGKTTALRLMLGLFHPDTGAVQVLGEQPSQRTAERIGYLPEERGLYREMKVVDLLRYYAGLKGLRAKEALIDDWLERLQIGDTKHQRIRALSKGTAQKVQFVSTVLHDPEILILDEPFSGLDPLSRQSLQAAIRQLTDAGKTLLFSTHDMNAAENLCDHFLMLHRGELVLDRSRSELGAETSQRVLGLWLETPTVLGPLPGVVRQVDHGARIELTLEENTDPRALLRDLLERYPIVRFELGHPSLEDIFLRLAGR